MAEASKIAGQSHATFWYPAVTDEELENTTVLISNYRDSMAQNRRLYLVGGILGAAWLFSYLKYGPRKGRR